MMGQVVKTVEGRLRGEPQAKPILVRLKIQASSHLLIQDPSALQTAFALAAQGTRAEGARLDIIPVAGEAWCTGCKTDAPVMGSECVCVACGEPIIAGQAAPEVVVHEVVVEE